VSASASSAAESNTAPAGWAAVVDFDGTLVVQDIGDLVATELGERAAWRAAEDEFAAGSIRFKTLLEKIFASVRVDAEAIAAFARARAHLRHGFEAFAAGQHAAGRPLVVCSAGLDVYVRAVLERLPAPLHRHIAVRANRALCSPQGMRLEFPGAGRGCDHCGSCKAPVVEDLRAAGWKVVFVGDGTSDRCGARVADFVFARGSLLRTCVSEGLPHAPFESFDEVVAGWPGAW
jgi:2-hydroxy-3-keto-5-methylthiopentenyl-1-phosphate phosphatase